MFSFHKPRVYRSAEGCCICRAKSSSSRFTDSKKYEADSVKCFNLNHPRHGEICNACVLLVKRYKRLPAGSNRHWGHVVDARAGPGMKSMTKFKKLKEEDRGYNQKSIIPEKFSKIFKKNKKKAAKDKNKSQQWESQPLPPTPESLDSDCDEVSQYTQNMAIAGDKSTTTLNRMGSNKRKQLPPRKLRNHDQDKVKFYDEKVWIKRKTCCGTVLENKQLGAIILDSENYVPCAEHQRKMIQNRTQPLSVPQQYTVVKSGTYHLQVVNPLPELPMRSSKPTPVLKKHHLFFKRQSESFPLGDMKQSTNNANAHEYPPKTDVMLEMKMLPISHPTSSSVKVAKLDPVMHKINHLPPSTSSKVVIYEPIQQQHQVMHKPASSSSSKSNSFLHKMKSDTGRIVKHSLEKISTLRLKPSELSEVKNLTKTVDKAILVKPADAVIQTQEKSKKNAIVVDSEVASASQSVATKFNDNSSDSGFDENVQDRKSVSPLDGSGDPMMYLVNNVQVQGESEDVMLAGNEMAEKLLLNREQNLKSNLKIAQLLANATGRIRQPSDGATIIATPSLSSITNISLPSTSSSIPTASHLNKTRTNIILNKSNKISTSAGQNVLILKTKYNATNNLNQKLRKN